MGTREHYDAVIVGAGQGGGPLASALARAGQRTALIEREHVGGTCINAGCTLTKTMVASAHIAHLARRASDFGVETGPVSVDVGVVRERKRPIVESFRSESEKRIESTDGLDLIPGEARFAGPQALSINLPGTGSNPLPTSLFLTSVLARQPLRCPVSIGCRLWTRPRLWSWMLSRSTCWSSVEDTSLWS